MGDLLSKDMLADLVINIINIVVLFIVTKKLLYKPVKKYLEDRKAKVASGFEEAEKMKAEALAQKAEYDAVIADADAKVKASLAESQAKAKEEAEKILAAAKAEAEGLLKESREEAEAERKQLLKAEKEDIVGAALDISGRILCREVTDADNRAIIDSFFGA